MERSDYALKDVVSTDGERLTAQYKLLKLSLGRETALPRSIDANKLLRVLDAATGSMAWILDLASMPEIQNKISSSQIELYACDITTAQFPPQEIIEGAKIKVLYHDVTKPFPEDLHGTFDLINMRCMLIALNKDNWTKAVVHLRQLLRPGGNLMLCDGPLNYCYPGKTNKMPPDVRELDGVSWLDDLNTVTWRTWYVKKNFVPDLANYLCILLDMNGFEVEEETPVTLPLGAQCRGQTGPLSKAMEAFEDYTAEIYPLTFIQVLSRCLADGSLEGPNGPMTEKELLRIVNAFQVGLKEHGACLYFKEITAKRRD